MPRNTHSASLLADLQLDALNDRREAHIVNLVEQILKGNCHPALKDMFTLDANGSVENQASARLQFGKRRFGIYAKLLFNNNRNG